MPIEGEDAGIDAIDEDHDDTAHQGCYIFRASEEEREDIDKPPKKRRKVSKSRHVEKERLPFPRLLGGQEPETSAKLRHDAFEEIWAVQQAKIDKIIAESNNSFIEDIARFVRYASKSELETKLPTGLVVVGKDSRAQQRLLHQWQSDERTKPSEYLIQLDHNQAANISSALKSIIRNVISSSLGQEGYVEFLSKHKRLTPMSYDLELLERFAEKQRVEKIVISVLDIESFDISVLSDLMAMLASWTDRIPFILLIGISTTVELFEARLPKSAIRRLVPRVFDLSGHAYNPIYKIFMATQHDLGSRLWLGPAAANAVLEKSKEQETTPETFGRTVKYAYMSHFFANALSVLAEPDTSLDEDMQTAFCEAVRNTLSFAEYVEAMLKTPTPKNAKAQNVARLLSDDPVLMIDVRENIAEGQAKMKKHYEAVADLKVMILSLRNTAAAQGQGLPEFDYMASFAVPDDIFDASVTTLAGPVAVEFILENLRLHDTLERISSDTFHTFLCFKPHATLPSLMDSKVHESLQYRAQALLANTFLSNDPNQATPDQQEYQNILTTFIALVEDGLRARLVDPTTLPYHEVFIPNSKNPLSQVFTPGPRYAIERALDRPNDYLGCECCANSEDSSSQPPTAILWRLWCEAGGVVNARDLWEAFRSTVVPQNHDEEGSEEEDGKEREALTLFYRSVAELQMLGMLKQSKRKPGVECFAKIGWRGM